MTSDRVALHTRMARGKWDAYANGPETGHITYGPDWITTPDVVMMCPQFNNGEELPMAQTLDPKALEDPELQAAFAKAGEDSLSCEMRMCWKYMPDFRLVSPFECTAEDWGFIMRDVYQGTTSDGTVISLHETDYLWTNEDGHITRWHWFVDSAEFSPYLELIGINPDGATYSDYIVNFMLKGAPQ
jgi:hypothetical protein